MQTFFDRKKEPRAGINGTIKTPSRELPRPTSSRRKGRGEGADVTVNTPSRELLRITSGMKQQTRLGIDGTINTPSRELLRPTKAFSGKVVKREVANKDLTVVTMEEAVAWMESEKQNRRKNGRHRLIQKDLISQNENKTAFEIRDKDVIIPTSLVKMANEPMAGASDIVGNSCLKYSGHMLSLQNDFNKEATDKHQNPNDYTQPILLQGEDVEIDQSTVENGFILRDNMNFLCLESNVNTSTDTHGSIDSITGQFESRLHSDASEVSAKLEREQIRAECCDDPVASILMTDTTPGAIQKNRKKNEKGKLQCRNGFTFSGSLSAFSPC